MLCYSMLRDNLIAWYSVRTWFYSSTVNSTIVDITSVIQIATNYVYHGRTKHIEVNCYFVQEVYDR